MTRSIAVSRDGATRNLLTKGITGVDARQFRTAAVYIEMIPKGAWRCEEIVRKSNHRTREAVEAISAGNAAKAFAALDAGGGRIVERPDTWTRQAVLDRLSRSPPKHCPHCGCSLITYPSKLLPK